MQKADVSQERLVTLKQLDNFGLNPFSVFGVLESYAKKIAPLPVKFQYMMNRKDLMDGTAVSQSMVELYIETAGYVGGRHGSSGSLDQVHANLLCRSYYTQLRPLAVSFQLANSVTIHLRTPGVSESDVINPLRKID